MKMDIGIINYNGGKALWQCVSSLLNQSIPLNILIFDNASTDNSLSLIESNKSCRIIRSSENLGYAGACNKLLEQMNSEIQVLCNMDLEFDQSWAQNLLAAFNRYPETGSVASLVIEKSGVVNAIGVLFEKDLFAENESSGKNISDLNIQEKEVFGCYGAVMAFRKECVKKVGLLDASFFLFFEESEWYFRHNLAGYKTIFCPEAKVYHERSLTTVRYSPLKLYYSERNRLRTAIRLLPFTEIIKLPIYGFLRYLRMVKKGVPQKTGDGKSLSKKAVIVALLKAWLQALVLIPKEWKVRKKYQKQYGSVSSKIKKLISKYSLSN